MESIIPSTFLGSLNKLSGIATESEGIMLNLQATDNLDYCQVTRRTRPYNFDLRDWNMTLNVTDSPLTVLGNRNNMFFWDQQFITWNMVVDYGSHNIST